MARGEPGDEKRLLIMQIVISAAVGIFAAFIVGTADERGFLWWLGVVVIAFNIGEIIWNLVRLRRLARDRERLQ